MIYCKLVSLYCNDTLKYGVDAIVLSKSYYSGVGTMLSTEDAIKYLINEIPALKAELYQDPGLFTMQMSTFARHTQHYIDSGDKKNTESCFKLAAVILRDGNSKVKNAMAVSYCESLNLHDQKKMRSWAKEIMPANLLNTYNDVNDYLDKLFSK